MAKKQVQVFKVTAGSLTRHYYTRHHAEQMARALAGNGLSPVITETKLPDDTLTRLSVA